MVKKYRKKPFVIEAQQWFTGVKIEGVIEDDEESCMFITPNDEGIFTKCALIETLEGTMKVMEGDYVIKGVKGEFYSLRKEIFEEIYEEVEDERARI